MFDTIRDNKPQEDKRGQPEPNLKPTGADEVDGDQLRQQLSEILGSMNLPGCGTGS